jgi:hypothetical protein
MIINIIITVIIPLVMFMIFSMYIIIIFADYGFGRVMDYCKKIGKTLT